MLHVSSQSNWNSILITLSFAFILANNYFGIIFPIFLNTGEHFLGQDGDIVALFEFHINHEISFSVTFSKQIIYLRFGIASLDVHCLITKKNNISRDRPINQILSAAHR